MFETQPINQVTFYFRVWLHSYDPSEFEYEIFYPALELTNPSLRFVTDWAKDVIVEQDFYELLNLDREKCWQVVGKATITCTKDYWGEYDEEFYIDEVEFDEVPESYFKGNNLLYPDDELE